MFVLFCFFLSLPASVACVNSTSLCVLCYSPVSTIHPIIPPPDNQCINDHLLRPLIHSLISTTDIFITLLRMNNIQYTINQSILHVGLKRFSRYAESIDRPFTTDQTKINRQIFHIFRHFQFWRINKFK